MASIPNDSPDDATGGASKPDSGSRAVFRLSTQGQNVGGFERAVSTFLGGALLLSGLRRRSASGAAFAAAGGALLLRGLSGHSRLYQWFGVNSAGAPPQPDAASHRTPSGQQSSAAQADSQLGARPNAASLSAFATIGRDARELFDLWREPQTLTQITRGFAQVTPISGGYNWKFNGPLGQSLEVETPIVESVAGELLRWESPAGAMPSAGGEIRFRPAPGGQGTELILKMQFTPSQNAGSIALAKVLKLVPATAAGMTLRAFQALAETGEIPTLEGNVSARGVGDSF